MEQDRHKIAVEELMKTKLIKNWALGELRAFKIDPESLAGRNFVRSKTRELAEKILSDRA